MSINSDLFKILEPLVSEEMRELGESCDEDDSQAALNAIISACKGAIEKLEINDIISTLEKVIDATKTEKTSKLHVKMLVANVRRALKDASQTPSKTNS